MRRSVQAHELQLRRVEHRSSTLGPSLLVGLPLGVGLDGISNAAEPVVRISRHRGRTPDEKVARPSGRYVRGMWQTLARPRAVQGSCVGIALVAFAVGCVPKLPGAAGDSPAVDALGGDTALTDSTESVPDDTAPPDSTVQTDSGPPSDDADGDGYLSMAAGGDDCDDADPTVHPGAVEVCDNGKDDDCDGTANGCGMGDVSLDDADAEYASPDGYDGCGVSVSGAGDFNGDGFADFVAGAEGDGSTPGKAYVVLGSATPTAGWLDDAGVRADGPAAGVEAGATVAGGADVNGDGYDDVVVASPYYTAAAIYLWLGSPTPTGVTLGEGVVWTPPTNANYGSEMAMLGDFNGDGFSDTLVGASDEYATRSGAVFLVPGSGSPESETLGSDTVEWSALRYDTVSSVAAGGDLDGDGFPDALVSDKVVNAAYVMFGGPFPVSCTLDSADATFTGVADSWAGSAVGGAGDVNMDGYSDFLVGASGDNAPDAGETYLVLGGSGLATTTLDSVGVPYVGVTSGSLSGTSVAGEDVDGDGYSDIIIGDATSDYLFRGSAAPAGADLSAADATISNADGGSPRLAAAGDFDDDGHGDLVVGAPQARSDAGLVYLLLGHGI